MHIARKTVLVLTLLICTAIIAGCGGGGGTTVTPTGTTISGVVTAPDSVSLARTAGRSASIRGVNPRARVTVTVYYIDDTGLKTGNILATTETNERGEYSLVLPANINLASNLVVAIGGGNNVMRAIVVSRTVNINPMTELVASKICSHGKPLSQYNVEDIAAMEAQVETDAASIDMSAADSVSAALAMLDTGVLASNLDAAIKVASGIVCGNRTVDEGEGCDDGNTANGDGCSSNCQVETTAPVCGNGTLETGEQCDDGNTVTEACTYGLTSCTVCDASCNSVAGAISSCGDGTTNGSETCDDGNAVTEACAYGQTSCTVCGDSCTSVAGVVAYCGDHVVNGAEGCDDGNTSNGDGCSSSCSVEVAVPVCGNGTREGSEACDDGNTVTEACAYGDTSCTVCSSVCTSVAGATSYCSDGTTNGSETCDDGNAVTETCAYGQTSCTVCNSTCRSTAGVTAFCGDNSLNGAEGCDDGNTITENCPYGQSSCVVCGANCQSVAGATSYCGDGTTNGSEPCDGTSLGGETCISKGFDGGTLSCSSCAFNTAGCTMNPVAQHYVSKWGTTGSGTGQYDNPRGMAVDGSGNVYVVDQNNNRVDVTDANGSHIAYIGPVIAGTTNLSVPEVVCISKVDGTIAIVEEGGPRVILFNSSQAYLREFGSYGIGNGQFEAARGCAFDSSNNIYVVDDTASPADTINHRVEKFDINGNFLLKWGSKGTVDGQFIRPWGITVDDQNNIYVSENDGNRIQKFTSNGTFVTKWGSIGTGNGYSSYPSYIGIDANNYIYVMDFGNDRTQVFSSSGTWLYNIGSSGSSDGQFLDAVGIAVTSAGVVYASDWTKDNIQKFTR